MTEQQIAEFVEQAERKIRMDYPQVSGIFKSKADDQVRGVHKLAEIIREKMS